MTIYVHYNKLKSHINLIQEEIRTVDGLESTLLSCIRACETEGNDNAQILRKQLQMIQMERTNIRKRLALLQKTIDEISACQRNLSETLQQLLFEDGSGIR